MTSFENKTRFKNLSAIILSALAILVSACGKGGADKDVSAYIDAWKTVGSSQTQVCSHIYRDNLEQKMEADTSKDKQESYMDFLGTLNALREYAKNNPAPRLEIRNTIYEVYGKMLYESDKKDYLEAEASSALMKAATLGDRTLMAEMYRMMAELTADEPLRSAIYHTKAIDILRSRGTDMETYTPELYAALSEVFFRADDYHDAIKYGNLYLEISEKSKDKDSTAWRLKIRTMDIVATSYMEINQWDSCSTVFESITGCDSALLEGTDTSGFAKAQTKAKGMLGIVQAKWKQFPQAKDNLEVFLKLSEKEKDTAGVIYALMGLSDIYSETGEPKKALSDLKQARRYAVTKRFPSLQKKVYDRLARAFEANNQEDSSAKVTLKLQNLELKIQEQRQRLEHLKTKTEYELQQIQTSIDNVSKEKKTRRSWSWLIILIVLLVGIIVFLVLGLKRFRTRIHKRLVRQNADKQKKEAEQELGALAMKLGQAGMIEEGGSTPQSLAEDEAWIDFRTKFSKANPLFFQNLDAALGRRATQAYEKVAALIYLGMDNDQIGKILKISKDSVARSKRRIRTEIGCQDLSKTISEF